MPRYPGGMVVHTLPGAFHSGRATKAQLEITLNKLLKGAGAGADPTEIDVPAAGEGHITILPQNYNAIVQGTWVWSPETVFGGYVLVNGPPANGDKLNWKVFLAAGTYVLCLLTITSPSRAIVTFDIDGTDVATFDLYHVAGENHKILTQTGIVVAGAGLKTLSARVNSRNVAASNWYIQFATIGLWRTA